MYVILIHGEGERLILNPNCQNRILYEYIRSKCDIEKDVFIDIADETTAEVKHLSEQVPDQYAIEFLTPRVSYILLKDIRKADEATGTINHTYVPLVSGLESTHQDFIEKLMKLNRGHNRRLERDGRSPTKGRENKGREAVSPSSTKINTRNKKLNNSSGKGSVIDIKSSKISPIKKKSSK